MDTRKRSLYKTISWHFLHLTIAGLVAYLITHRLDFAALIASAELLWESVVFYLHERAWSRVKAK
jgi:uncharacterized membrane protein